MRLTATTPLEQPIPAVQFFFLWNRNFTLLGVGLTTLVNNEKRRGALVPASHTDCRERQLLGRL